MFAVSNNQRFQPRACRNIGLHNNRTFAASDLDQLTACYLNAPFSINMVVNNIGNVSDTYLTKTYTVTPVHIVYYL